MIIIKNLSLLIKKGHILKEIDIEFERGKIHGLIGRNGSGKTMLMKTNRKRLRLSRKYGNNY